MILSRDHILMNLFLLHILIDLDSTIFENESSFGCCTHSCPYIDRYWILPMLNNGRHTSRSCRPNLNILMFVRLFRLYTDLLTVKICSSSQQLFSYFELYSFVFIGEMFRSFERVRSKVQLLLGHKLNPVCLAILLKPRLRILRYSFINQLSFSGSVKSPFSASSRWASFIAKLLKSLECFGNGLMRPLKQSSNLTYTLSLTMEIQNCIPFVCYPVKNSRVITKINNRRNRSEWSNNKIVNRDVLLVYVCSGHSV